MKTTVKATLFAVCACMGIGSFASIPSYQVYDLKFKAVTTEAKGITTVAASSCYAGEDYCFREKKAVVIKGVLAGCGCGAILANGSCDNARLYLWDDTRKLAITNVETSTGWRLQVIGKNQKTVEHFMRLTAVYGDNDEYRLEMTLCGFGTNKVDAKNPNYSYVSSISGYFAGVISAPYYYKAGTCGTCSSTDEIYMQSEALPSCSCSAFEDMTDDVTPFGGTYVVSYNSAKSKNATKKGISKKVFGLPDFVDLDTVTDIVD